ncbi:hypothetical protein [Kitasatospora sp. NBC_01300]|uniref:hypothetical protein n=1 Tax=Kitasatospora sp. NBC_01300 TaxID=2903574 RepID=UPI00352BFA53|nr:hypothetical protein OG556_16445 [Kitasatospora sp. NBC_01300]
MAARKPITRTASEAEPPADPVAEQAADLPPVELSAAAPIEPPPEPGGMTPEPDHQDAVSPGLTVHQPLATDHVELVDEDGNPLPRDLEQLFDLTHPEWTVIYPRVRIYQNRTYAGTRRAVTQLLYVPAQSIPRAEFDRFRQALGWE